MSSSLALQLCKLKVAVMTTRSYVQRNDIQARFQKQVEQQIMLVGKTPVGSNQGNQ